MAQGKLCGICGQGLPHSSNDATLDHVIPMQLGGADALGNFILAHRACNSAKANDVPTGCEMVWLMAVNAKLGVLPVVF
jgi:5-methylcytosine-specific restriction endonuclease McrA